MAKEKIYCNRCGRRIKSGKHCKECLVLISKEKINNIPEEDD